MKHGPGKDLRRSAILTKSLNRLRRQKDHVDIISGGLTGSDGGNAFGEKEMKKTKIEWCDYSWNPIKGICPVDCKTPDGKSYCYARKIYRRFMNDKYSDGSLSFVDPFMNHPKLPRRPSRIFVCSTIELFHPQVRKKWRKDIFTIIKKNRELIFVILTKLPHYIDGPMPENVWLGVSITGSFDCWRAETLMK